MKKLQYKNNTFLQKNLGRNLANDHLTNFNVQKVIKTKFANNYRAYARIKNQMIKMRLNSLCIFSKEWFGDSL